MRAATDTEFLQRMTRTLERAETISLQIDWAYRCANKPRTSVKLADYYHCKAKAYEDWLARLQKFAVRLSREWALRAESRLTETTTQRRTV